MNLYKKNLKKLTNANAYYPSLEHDACGVDFFPSVEATRPTPQASCSRLG